MPTFAASKAELMSASALDRTGLDVAHLDGVVAVGGSAPLHKTVTLEKVQINTVKLGCNGRIFKSQMNILLHKSTRR